VGIPKGDVRGVLVATGRGHGGAVMEMMDRQAVEEMNKKRMAQEIEDLRVLVDRAEKALDVLAKWYCKDVKCKRCRVQCSSYVDIAYAAYDEVVHDDYDA